MSDSDTPLIHSTVGSITLQGRFLHRSRTAIEVELVAPVGPLSQWHFLVSFSRTLMPDGLMGEEGMRQGVKMVRAMYRLMRRLQSREDEILKLYRAYVAIVDQHHAREMGDEMFAIWRDLVEAKRASGDLDDATAARQLRNARIDHSRYHERRFEAKRLFIQRAFGDDVVPELHDQLLAHVKRLAYG